MSALGQKQTFAPRKGRYVRFAPESGREKVRNAGGRYGPKGLQAGIVKLLIAHSFALLSSGQPFNRFAIYTSINFIVSVVFGIVKCD